MATRTGHEVGVGLGYYDYIEPGDLRISIHGPRLALEYTGTFSLNERRHWFMDAGIRVSAGAVAYEGWCLPWLIRPDGRSPNGYALGLGDPSACGFSGDEDGSIDVRALVGKDLFSRRWGLSPVSGLGVRYLSNSTSGLTDFRTDTYLYLPVGLTARSRVGSGHVLSLSGEFDILLRGQQTTHESQLGGGEIEATSTAPGFTIDGFTDITFPQHRGWAVRAGAKYQLTRRWSIAPKYIHWGVEASEVRSTTVRFTVNGVTASQELGAIEPVNSTDEWSVAVGFHF